MKTMTLKVEGMMCPHCEKHVTQALAALPQVESCRAEHSTDSVILTINAPIDEETLRATIEKAGYNYCGKLL